MPAQKVESSSFVALLMSATLLGIAPSATSARFRGPKKGQGLHNKSGKNASPNATVEKVEVEQSGRKEKTGNPPAGEPESATAATLSEKKNSPPEAPEEEEMLAVVDKKTNSAVKKATKLVRKSHAEQRREGEVDDRDSDDFDAGRLGDGVADGADGVMAEHRVTDVHEGTLELEADDDDAECVTVGPCFRCEQREMDAEYCKETGRRQEVRCRPRDAPDAFGIVRQEGQAGVVGLPSSVQYRSCEYTDEDDMQAFVKFWFSMVLLGVVACFGMRRRQKKIRSLYDQRAM